MNLRRTPKLAVFTATTGVGADARIPIVALTGPSQSKLTVLSYLVNPDDGFFELIVNTTPGHLIQLADHSCSCEKIN
jgi:hypothetical protein